MTVPTPAAPGAAPAAGLIPEPARHPHAGFNALLPIVAQMLAQDRDPGNVLHLMSAYVSALALDDWFDNEWAALAQKRAANGVSRTGLAGGMPLMEYRLRQYRLIMRGARRYHLLETEQTPSSWKHYDEKERRLSLRVHEAEGETA